MVKKLPPKILVNIPDNAFSTAVCNIIERYWFNTIKSNKYEDTIKLIITHKPHIIVISDMFDKESILNLINNANSVSSAPLPFVILVSSNIEYNFNSELIAIIHKPFTPYEIMGAIKSLLRKSNPIFQTKILSYEDITMDLATYKVLRGPRQIHLGPTEFKILQLFMSSPENTFSRTEIIEYVWGKEHQIDPRTIDVHINRIRALLKNSTDIKPLIKTVRSSGYCLKATNKS